jgi:hypothetical protein
MLPRTEYSQDWQIDKAKISSIAKEDDIIRQLIKDYGVNEGITRYMLLKREGKL